jgi:hypothetical protein
MQRLTARFLLLFALLGTFVPLALAVTAEPPHACCLRKALHQCHGADSDERAIAIHSNSCCNQNSSRAVTTPQSAHPQTPLASISAQNVEARLTESPAASPVTRLFASRSTRAPPQLSIA